jgi:MoaA/NifB/PqqE/SkfB family radical SAM enzyme
MATNSNNGFCPKPFSELSALADGRAQCCCPEWLKVSLGNLKDQSIEEIWNGKQMQKVRQGIIDGSYRMCKADACPFIASGKQKVPVLPEVQSDYDAKRIKLDHGPLMYNMSHDQHCNLACPSCRVGFITGLKEDTKVMHKKIMDDALHDVKLLLLSGDGDPFSSPLYLNLLRSVSAEKFPKLKRIILMTNGILWNERMWNSISACHSYVKDARISIDGATKETYELNRKGGKWKVLMRNMDFIKTLGLQIILLAVIQDNNFREIPLFVELAQKYDWEIQFSKVLDCGTWPREEFEKRAVWMDDHPNQEELKSLIRKYRDTPKVSFQNLSAIL